MFELIYHSLASPGITTTDIANILDTSRHFNRANNVTGCLVFHNQEFIQILEGDKKTVQDLFASIQKDSRHSNVMLLEEAEKEERMFPTWNMAYFNSSSSGIKESDMLLFKSNFIMAAAITEKPTHATKLFWHMSKQLLEEKE
jgi:Sensors of blue-light using FAD